MNKKGVETNPGVTYCSWLMYPSMFKRCPTVSSSRCYSICIMVVTIQDMLITYLATVAVDVIQCASQRWVQPFRSEKIRCRSAYVLNDSWGAQYWFNDSLMMVHSKCFRDHPSHNVACPKSHQKHEGIKEPKISTFSDSAAWRCMKISFSYLFCFSFVEAWIENGGAGSTVASGPVTVLAQSRTRGGCFPRKIPRHVALAKACDGRWGQS